VCGTITAALQFFSLAPDVLLRPLLPLLTSGNEEAVVEAARAVSNLARSSAAIQASLLHSGSKAAGGADGTPAGSVYEELAADSNAAGDVPDAQQSSSSNSSGSCLLVGQYVLQALVLLLAHSSWEVVYNVAGALLNLTATAGGAAALHAVSAAMIHQFNSSKLNIQGVTQRTGI
jgi:TPP-dependent indolepyruvate ferredoxin oxidoreductase alpha subunit